METVCLICVCVCVGTTVFLLCERLTGPAGPAGPAGVTVLRTQLLTVRLDSVLVVIVFSSAETNKCFLSSKQIKV